MKPILALYLIFSLALHTATSISMQDTKPKTYSKTYNHIQTSHKPQLYYHHLQQQQQQLHQQQQQQQQQPHQQIIYQPQYVPVSVLAKAAYAPQPQQQIPTMIIIAAQPTAAAYPAPIQQLLNYFHSNPQARQQFLYGGGSHQQATTPTYVVAAAPAQYYTPAPAQYYYTAQPQQYTAQPQQQQTQEAQPLQLQQLAEMAQTTAQRLYGGQIKTAAPIITGLENFTPDQQAQIKARLNDVISQDQQQQHGGGAMHDFVPSPQIKGEEGGVAYIGGSEASGQGYSTKG